MTVRKQLSYGLQLQVAYTWARAFVNAYVGNPAATTAGIAPYINPYLLNPGYRPQRLVLNYSWNIPTGKHDGVMGQMLNGWNWSGVTTIQGGNPLLITDSRDGSAFGNAGSGPIDLATLVSPSAASQVLASGSLKSRVISGLTGGTGYFNGAAFCRPTSTPPCALPTVGSGNGTGFGSYGLSPVRGPGQNNWDMSVAKTFNVTEGKTLQFRTEFFNTFNHTMYVVPFTDVATGTFGQIGQTAVNPRLMQFALKFLF